MKLKSFCVLVACLVVQTHCALVDVNVGIQCKSYNGSQEKLECTLKSLNEKPCRYGNLKLIPVVGGQYSVLPPFDLKEVVMLRIDTYPPLKRIPTEIFGQVASLEILVLKNLGITKFTKKDLQGANSLLSLDLSKNKIHEIPADLHSTAPKLEILKLEENGMTKIKSGKINHPTLKELHLNDNQLTSLEPGTFLGAKNLENISLDGNSIATIKAGTFKLQNLHTLSLSSNGLTSLPDNLFLDAPNLKDLCLFSNKLTTIQNSENLRTLNLSSNLYLEIQVLPNLQLWPNLTKLVLSYNRQTSLKVQGTHNLEELSLQSCALNSGDLLGDLEGLGELRKLRIDYNQLTKLNRFNEIGTMFPKLKEISAAANRWDDVWCEENRKYCTGELECPWMK